MTLLRMRSLAVSAALVAAALLSSHELIYRTAHGAQIPEAMSARGHDAYWVPFVVGVVLAALLVGSATAVRLWRLTRLVAESSDPSVIAHVETASFLPPLYRTWIRVWIATALLFALQENFELLSMAVPLPGLQVLADAGGIPMVLIAGVTFLLSLLVTAARWHHELLLTCLAAIQPRWPRVARSRRPHAQDRAPAAHATGPRRVRAPPVVAIG